MTVFVMDDWIAIGVLVIFAIALLIGFITSSSVDDEIN